MFSHAYVSHSVHREEGSLYDVPGQRHSWTETSPGQRSPPIRRVDSTHPTGMHSCFHVVFGKQYWQNNRLTHPFLQLGLCLRSPGSATKVCAVKFATCYIPVADPGFPTWEAPNPWFGEKSYYLAR